MNTARSFVDAFHHEKLDHEAQGDKWTSAQANMGGVRGPDALPVIFRPMNVSSQIDLPFHYVSKIAKDNGAGGELPLNDGENDSEGGDDTSFGISDGGGTAATAAAAARIQSSARRGTGGRNWATACRTLWSSGVDVATPPQSSAPIAWPAAPPLSAG